VTCSAILLAKFHNYYYIYRSDSWYQCAPVQYDFVYRRLFHGILPTEGIPALVGNKHIPQEVRTKTYAALYMNADRKENGQSNKLASASPDLGSI